MTPLADALTALTAAADLIHGATTAADPRTRDALLAEARETCQATVSGALASEPALVGVVDPEGREMAAHARARVARAAADDARRVALTQRFCAPPRHPAPAPLRVVS